MTDFPTQGGGAGDLADALDDQVFRDLTKCLDVGRARSVLRSALSTLQAAPSEGGEVSDLEQRAFHAANAEWTVPEYQQLVRDLWRACCDGSEAARPPAPSEEPLVGCVVVPREPTEAMLRKAIALTPANVSRDNIVNAWNAMLEADPAPDAIRGGGGALRPAGSVPSSGKSDTEANHGAAK